MAERRKPVSGDRRRSQSPKSDTILHVRSDSDSLFDALFNNVDTRPQLSSYASRDLPPSFFDPEPIRMGNAGHNRDGSLDSTGQPPQQPSGVSHARTRSLPAQLSYPLSAAPSETVLGLNTCSSSPYSIRYLSLVSKHTRTQTCTTTWVHARTRHACPPTHACARAYPRTHTHAHTHTPTWTRKHTNTHTQTQFLYFHKK